MAGGFREIVRPDDHATAARANVIEPRCGRTKAADDVEQRGSFPAPFGPMTPRDPGMAACQC